MALQMPTARVLSVLTWIALVCLPWGQQTSVHAAESSPVIWIEAEQYAGTNFADHWETSSMGKEKLLSGGQWIMKGAGPDEIPHIVPDEGVTLKYRVQPPKEA